MDLMARRRAIMGMPSGKDYTVSGNVVSISNALAKNAKSAIVTFLPKQSGSGDPSPDNVRPISGYNDISAVRYGKNLFNKDGTDTSKGYVAGKYLDYTGGEVVPGSGSFAISEYIPILPNTSYTVSGLPTSNAWSPSICQYDSNHTFISGANYGNSVTKTITTGANAAYVRMSIPMGNINSLQLEVGNTATSYEPYISPVTANVHVGGAGKNKFNVNAIPDSSVLTITGGNIVITGASANTAKTLSDLSDCVAGQTYTLTATTTATSKNYIYLVSSASSWYFGTSRTITQTDLDSRVLVYGNAGETTTISNMMIRPSSVTDATFEPYSIFGGTVDLVSGECVVDMGYVDLGTKNYLYRNSRFDATFSDGKLTLLNSGGAKAIASAYARSTNAYSSIPDLAFNFGSGYVNGSTCSIVVHDSRYTDATSFKSAVSGVMLCYELANPITYHLTPSQLALLKGNNTVYSNEGSISLTYVGK